MKDNRFRPIMLSSSDLVNIFNVIPSYFFNHTTEMLGHLPASLYKKSNNQDLGGIMLLVNSTIFFNISQTAKPSRLSRRPSSGVVDTRINGLVHTISLSGERSTRSQFIVNHRRPVSVALLCTSVYFS